jgi:rubrerythrin
MKLEKGNLSKDLYYGNYLVRKVENKPSKKRQLWILNNHPVFTGVCSNCGFQYEKNTNNWTCPQCGTSYEQ